jgi:hypothetical protein
MKNIFLLLTTALLLVACQPMLPALSVPDTQKKEPLPVKGRQGLLINQKLSFADYQTGKVKRSWTKGGNSRVGVLGTQSMNGVYIDLISKEYIDRKQTFSFQMSDSKNNQSDVYGASNFNAENLLIGNNPNSVVNILEDIYGKNDFSENVFYLQVFVNNETRPWELLLDNQAALANKNYVGFFAKDDNNYYTLKPIDKVETAKGPKSILMGSIGFEIINRDNEVVAAVSLIDNGLVYLLTEQPDERFLLANLCAALLLQQNIAE